MDRVGDQDAGRVDARRPLRPDRHRAVARRPALRKPSPSAARHGQPVRSTGPPGSAARADQQGQGRGAVSQLNKRGIRRPQGVGGHGAFPVAPPSGTPIEALARGASQPIAEVLGYPRAEFRASWAFLRARSWRDWDIWRSRSRLASGTAPTPGHTSRAGSNLSPST